MKVTLNELISNRLRGEDIRVVGNTVETVFEGNYYQTETCYPCTSEDISNEELLEFEVDNFQEFKEELKEFLSCGFNGYNEGMNCENYNGMDIGFIPNKGFLYDTMDMGTPEFYFPDSEYTCVTVYITLSSHCLECDKEYEVKNVELGDNFEDNPGNHCLFGVFISDKCYYNLWKRYLSLTGKDT